MYWVVITSMRFVRWRRNSCGKIASDSAQRENVYIISEIVRSGVVNKANTIEIKNMSNILNVSWRLLYVLLKSFKIANTIMTEEVK